MAKKVNKNNFDIDFTFLHARNLIVVLFSVIMLVSCERQSPTWKQMDIAESLLNTKPDSALAILEGIPAFNVKGKETSARYALLKSMALDKNCIDTTTFDVLQPAIDYYIEHGSPDEQLRTYYYQGRIYQNKGDDDAAMQSFMRGKEYCQEATDTLIMANLMVAQGSIQYSIYKIDEFINNNLEAANLYKIIGRTDYEILSLANALDGSILNNDYTSKTRSSLKYMAILPRALELNGDFAGALQAYQDFSTTIDSIHMNIFSHDLLFSKERHEMEKLNLIETQKKDKVIWLSLCITCVLLIFISYIYYRYKLGLAKIKLDDKEKIRLQLEQENLKRENENLELERHNAILEKQAAELECERQSLTADNLRLKIEQLENESEALKEVLERQKDLAKPVEDAIKIRIEMLNGLLASRITDNTSYAEPYRTWKDQVIQDKDEFMNTTRLAFKASHPKFIKYLEQHGLTESEINYVCLYAIGLRGKEVGEYMQLKRHYHISSDVRKKLGIDEHQTNIGIYIRKLMKQL